MFNKNWLFIVFLNEDDNIKLQKKLISNGWSWDGGVEIKNSDKHLLLKKVGWVKLKNSDKKKIKYKRIRISSFDNVINTFTPIVLYDETNELINDFLSYKEPEYNNSLFDVKELINEQILETPDLEDKKNVISYSDYSKIVDNKVRGFYKTKEKGDWVW